MAQVEIVLTFDDGPHSVSGSKNRTRKVLDVLSNNPTFSGMKAAFFIQSHAKSNGSYYRGNTTGGRAVLEEALNTDHLVQIHTGMDGEGAHTPANNHINREAAGELGNDLQRCKSFIASLNYIGAPHNVRYVRPTGGAYNTAVLNRYSAYNLKMIYWDIDSRDSQGYTPTQVANHLYNAVKSKVQNGSTRLVVLFHDVNGNTSKRANLEKYFNKVNAGVVDGGGTPVWVNTQTRIREIFEEVSWTSHPDH